MKGVYFEPNICRFPSTYISNSTRMTVKMVNETDKVVKVDLRDIPTINEEKEKIREIDIYNPSLRGKAAQIGVYYSDIFKIEPNRFEIWPRSTSQIVVSFSPLIAIKYESVVYAQIDDINERIPLAFFGTGLPPVAKFVTPNIIVGNVFLDSIFEYKVYIQNVGNVVVDFEIEPYDTKNLGFSFNPSFGQIPIDNSFPISVTFIASSVGVFNESFVFKIKGATCNHPIINFSGKVIGPSFVVNPRHIEFGDVGYGFLHTETFTIENSSEIPFDYFLRISYDHSFEKREFQVYPEKGTIGKYSSQLITIDFIPITVQKYSFYIYVDISRFGTSLCDINITANCICPSLSISPSHFDLKNVFIGYEYPLKCLISNSSTFPGKFEFVTQDEKSKKDTLISFSKFSGVVAANDSSQIDIKFTPLHIGSIKQSAFCKVVGSNDPPIAISFSAICIGPIIHIPNQIINFGNVNVLKETTHSLEIQNSSLIPASYKVIIDSTTGGFAASPPSGTIPPNSTFNVDIVAYLNDITQFSGNMKVLIDYLNAIIIPLKANGVGSPLVASCDLKTIELGVLLAEQELKYSFSVENKANRSIDIQWIVQKSKNMKEIPSDFLFEIKPDVASLLPKTSCSFDVVILSASPIQFNIGLQCYASIQKQRFEAFCPVFRGIYVQPLLEFSPTSISFDDIRFFNKNSNMEPLTKILSITNKTKLPVSFSVVSPEPFNVDSSLLELAPYERKDIIVSFNPNFKNDFINEAITQRLYFEFNNHPQSTSIALRASFNFPDVSFDPKSDIDFGIIMMNTEINKKINVINNSNQSIQIIWELLSKDQIGSRSFDVFPLNSTIEPNSNHDVYFTFFASDSYTPQGDIKECIAICHVLGGPDHLISLKGQSAPINYEVTPTIIDFGQKNINDELESYFSIQNLSKVPIMYEIDMPIRTKFTRLSLSPTKGVININDSVRIYVHAFVGIPKFVKEILFIKICGFGSVQIEICSDSCFSQTSFTLPRNETDPSYLSLINGSKKVKKALSSTKRLSVQKSKLILDKIEPEVYNFTESQLLHEEKSLSYSSLAPLKPSGSYKAPTAHYIIDFGPFTQGEQKRMKFDVISHVSFPVSFSIDSSSLKNTGFHLEPSNVKGLMPNSKISIECIFQPSMRTISEFGDVLYRLSVNFIDKHSVLLFIKATLRSPVLKFSSENLEFGHVIIGQIKALPLQIQNMNSFPCEFSIGEPSILSSQTSKPTKRSPYHITPISSFLPPSSFLNLSVFFEPTKPKSYCYRFPIHIKYSPTPMFFNVSGSGDYLKLEFSPSVINFPISQPFGDPIYMDLIVKNPNPYSVEFFSLQFDSVLYSESNIDPRQTQESPFVTYTPMAKTSQSASKFAICLIINGPPFSGKTSIAHNLSVLLNLPIINLKSIWEGSENDEISRLYSLISSESYSNGFIIDGLDVFDSPIENEMFLQQCMKYKNLDDDLATNPFTEIPHQQSSSLERALDLLLSSLDGHFVFHIAVTVSSEESKKRQDQCNNDIDQIPIFIDFDPNYLKNMGEDEYLSFPDEKRLDIDLKRKEIRKRELEALTMSMKEEDVILISKKKDEIASSRSSKKKTKQVPMDKLSQKYLIFQYSLGTICGKLKNAGERYRVIDPSEIQKITAECICIFQNSILLDGSKLIDPIVSSIVSFIPPIPSIKEIAFKKLIPDGSIIDDKAATDFIKLANHIPVCFFIENQNLKGTKEDNEEISKRLTNRWVLEPKSEITLKIGFDPDSIGKFSDDLKFAIAHCSSSPQSVKVHGLCSYPDINRDPKNIFNKIKKDGDESNFPVYIPERNTLSFGNTYTCKEKPSKNNFQFKEPIKFTNISDFAIECTVLFNDGLKSTIWNIDPPSFIIGPNESHDCIIGFHPISNAVFSTQLTCFIKDNPTPFSFGVLGDSSSPCIEISDDLIDFGKVLVGNKPNKLFKMTNNGKISSFWRIKGHQQLLGIVDLKETEGFIASRRSFSICFVFDASKPLSVKKTLTLEVMDSDKISVYTTYNIVVTAEAFDVNFDVLMPKGSNDLFDFGILKIGQQKTISPTIRNRGKYPVEYVFSIIDKRSEKLLCIVPNSGILVPSEKGIPINISFSSEIGVLFEKSKAIQVVIKDTQTGTITATLYYFFSAQTVFNSYETNIPKLIDFGFIQVSSTLQKDFVISNTGEFPLDFEFKNSIANESPDLKGKIKKGKDKSLIIVPFSITPTNGIINPKQQITVSFSILSNEASQFVKELFLCINSASPKKSKLSISLRSNVINPSILSDNRSIMPKLPQLSRSELEKNDINCFIIEDRTIHFTSVAVSKKEIINLKLINPNPIDVALDMIIKSKSKINAFEINDKALSIEPNGYKTLSIHFCPTSSDVFTAILELAVKGSTDTENKLIKFGLEGSGVLPGIELITQIEQQKIGYSYGFGKTIIGLEKTKRVAIANNNLIPANVTISIKQNPDFEILGLNFSGSFQMEKNSQFSFSVLYKPEKPRKSQIEILFSCSDNPKCQIPLVFSGEGYIEDVVFEGLVGDDPELHFRDSVIGKISEATFCMKNVTDKEIRFQWNSPNEITMRPKVGHLWPKQSKQIYARFLSEKPIKLNGNKIPCAITKIELIDENPIDWDDSQTITKFLPRSDVEIESPRRISSNNSLNQVVRVSEVIPEPAYKIDTSSKPKDTSIKVFCNSDSIKCSLDTNEIAFQPTMMYQSRTMDVKITNTCMVRMEYQWSLSKYESTRTDYHRTRPCPFTIEPNTGFIESGASSTFHIIFSPMEVDDFIVDYECQVAYLNASEWPKLSISGFSKRPLCHFNCDFSEYLFRRSSAFTNKLPEGVKVIEIVSKANKNRVSKKVEIINPTSSPYETKWRLLSEPNSIIQCDSSSAVVSGGKHYVFSFSFSPINNQTFESLWEFSIPLHEIKLSFLIVGRVLQ